MLQSLIHDDPLFAFILAWQVLGLVVISLFPQYWLIVILALLASHLFVVLSCLWTGSFWPGPVIRNLDSGSKPLIYLTFDDGPDPEITPQVMKILDQYQTSASFFCIGEKASQHPAIIKQLAAAGHMVENHSWSHPLGFFFLPWRALRRQVKKTADLIESLTTRKPVYFRAPAGIRSPLLQMMLKHQGLLLAGWSKRGFDTVTADTDKILGRLLDNIRSGDILLVHDGSSARDRDQQPVVLSVLPRLLERLQQSGYQVTHLPQKPL